MVLPRVNYVLPQNSLSFCFEAGFLITSCPIQVVNDPLLPLCNQNKSSSLFTSLMSLHWFTNDPCIINPMFFPFLPRYKPYLQIKGHLTTVLSHITEFLHLSGWGLFFHMMLSSIDNKRTGKGSAISSVSTAVNIETYHFHLQTFFVHFSLSFFKKAKVHCGMALRQEITTTCGNSRTF